jgi:hypothetical protein
MQHERIPGVNDPQRGKPRGILSVVLIGAEARSGAEVYNIVDKEEIMRNINYVA